MWRQRSAAPLREYEYCLSASHANSNSCAVLCCTALCRVVADSKEVRAALLVLILILVLVLVFRVRVASLRFASHHIASVIFLSVRKPTRCSAIIATVECARRPAIIWCIRHEIERAQWALAPASADENSSNAPPHTTCHALCPRRRSSAQCFAALFAASVLNFAQISSSTVMRLYANS